MTNSSDRPRGILSPADRAFLRGEACLESEQSVYDARYRIRQRVRNAILDCSILFEHLEAKDRAQIFDPQDESRAEFTNAIIDALAFLYLGTERYDVGRENLIAESVRRVERARSGTDGIVSATVSIERATCDHMASILDRIEAGDVHELTDEELRAFAHLCGKSCDVPPREALSRHLDDG
jgi:hypothetical protein